MKGADRRQAPGKGHMLGLVHGMGGTFLLGFAKAHDCDARRTGGEGAIFRAMWKKAWLGHQSATVGQWGHLQSPGTPPHPRLSSVLLFQDIFHPSKIHPPP